MRARLRSLWRNLAHRDKVEHDLDDEVDAMHALLVEEKIRAGMDPAAARRAATIELGHVHILKQHVRDARAGAFWDALVQDVRCGVRLLARNPLFTLTASLSLAICIGANTAMFTVANRLLFRDPAGVANPDRLVDIAPTDGRKLIQPVVPTRVYEELRQRTTLLDVYGLSFDPHPLSMRTDGAAERIFGTFVSSSYLALMEIQASRQRARTGPDGGLIPITEQDRARWVHLLIRRGLDALARAEALGPKGGDAGPYVLQAALAACHARARRAADTDWPRIAALYDRLRVVAPSPVVDLNRAIAHSMAFGPDAGLRLVDEIADAAALRDYAPLPAARGDFLFRAGRLAEARSEFTAAAALTRNARERAFLLARADACD